MMGRPNSRSIFSALAIVLAAAVPTLTTSAAHADPGDEAADTAPTAEPKADAKGDVEAAPKPEAKKKHTKRHVAKGAHADAAAPKKAKSHAKSSGKTASAAPAPDKPHAAKAKKGKKTASRGPSKKKTEKKGDGKAPKRPAVASQQTDGQAAPCGAASSAIDRAGRERETLTFVDCEGAPREEALVRLSVLARDDGAKRPRRVPKKLPKRRDHGADTAPLLVAKGVRLLDPGLAVRLDAVARKFPGKTITVVTGYRGDDNGSLHHAGRALDVRVADVAPTELVELCKSLPDTGCGLYPSSASVHFDVRPAGAGAVSWIDASGPGEAPRYVASWPPAEPGAPAAAEAPAAAAGGAAAHADIDHAAAALDPTVPEPAVEKPTTRAAAGPTPARKR